MVNNSNNSFIPKRGSSKRSVTKAARPVYIFTVVSYVLVFASLLATGVVFMYSMHLETQLENELIGLSTDINTFSEADMLQVFEFDARMKQVFGRVDNSVSITSVLQILESTTIDTVKIKSLEMERINDDRLELVAKLKTDSLGSTIFQRKIHDLNDLVASTSVSDLDASRALVDGQKRQGEEGEVLTESEVLVEVELDILLPAVAFQGVDNPTLPEEDIKEELGFNLNNQDSL